MFQCFRERERERSKRGKEGREEERSWDKGKKLRKKYKYLMKREKWRMEGRLEKEIIHDKNEGRKKRKERRKKFKEERKEIKGTEEGI